MACNAAKEMTMNNSTPHAQGNGPKLKAKKRWARPGILTRRETHRYRNARGLRGGSCSVCGETMYHHRSFLWRVLWRLGVIS